MISFCYHKMGLWYNSARLLDDVIWLWSYGIGLLDNGSGLWDQWNEGQRRRVVGLWYCVVGQMG